jgi:hypothetical protein
MEDDMTTQTQLQCRHSLRPLSVFSFCGQPIAAPREEYVRTTRNLPPCLDCQNARNRAARTLATNYRPSGATWGN